MLAMQLRQIKSLKNLSLSQFKNTIFPPIPPSKKMVQTEGYDFSLTM